jgi:hypothetical protein
VPTTEDDDEPAVTVLLAGTQNATGFTTAHPFWVNSGCKPATMSTVVASVNSNVSVIL